MKTNFFEVLYCTERLVDLEVIRSLVFVLTLCRRRVFHLSIIVIIPQLVSSISVATLACTHAYLVLHIFYFCCNFFIVHCRLRQQSKPIIAKMCYPEKNNKGIKRAIDGLASAMLFCLADGVVIVNGRKLTHTISVMRIRDVVLDLSISLVVLVWVVCLGNKIIYTHIIVGRLLLVYALNSFGHQNGGKL